LNTESVPALCARSASQSKIQPLSSNSDSGGLVVSGKKLASTGSRNYILTVAVIAPCFRGHPRFGQLNLQSLSICRLRQPLGSSQTPPSRRYGESVVDRNRGRLLHVVKVERRGAMAPAGPLPRHSDELARAQLVEAYFAQQDYKAVARSL